MKLFSELRKKKSNYVKAHLGFIKKKSGVKPVSEQFYAGAGPEFDYQSHDEQDKLRSSLIKHYNTLDKLPTEHKKAVQDYGDQLFMPINKKLHGDRQYHKKFIHGNTDDFDGDDAIKKHIDDSEKRLSESIKKQEPTPHSFFVYTGIKHNMNDAKVDQETGHIHIHNPAYTSTSLSINTAETFARSYMHNGKSVKHIIKMEIPKGAHGTFMEHYGSIGENEFLLHKDAKFHIHPEPDKPTETHRVWHAKLVHDGVKEIK